MFSDAADMNSVVWMALMTLAERPSFGNCSVTAAQILKRHETDSFRKDLDLIFRDAYIMALRPRYFQVYSADQRRWLEDTARRWSDKESIKEEFSCLHMGGVWFGDVCAKWSKQDLDYEAIDIGLKRWMAEQNGRWCQSSNWPMLSGSGNGRGQMGVYKVKMM